MGPCRGEQAHLDHGAGLIGWHTLPSSISPLTVHPWETSLLRLQGCDSSSGHYGLNGIESASFVVYSVFILSFELFSFKVRLIFSRGVCIFYIEWQGLFVYFGDEFLVGIFICKYFFLF